MRIDVDGKKISILTGPEEIELLRGLLANALQNWPRFETGEKSVNDLSSARRRMANMHREMGYYLGLSINRTPVGHHLPKDTQCPYCERNLRGENAMKAHIKRVHSKEENATTNND